MEMNKLKKMMRKMEGYVTAASFAEEGEFESAQSLLQEEKTVLLALREGHVDPKTLKYAMNASKRIGAHLDILYISSTGESNLDEESMLLQYQSELKADGVPAHLVRKTGCIKQEIIDYTNKEQDVIFAVVDSPNSLDGNCKKNDSRLSELWQKLRCPLVVVMEGTRA
jgi:hypothetical protein